MIAEYIIIHSDIPNYTKLAFNSLKMIRNDLISQLLTQCLLLLMSVSAVNMIVASIIVPLPGARVTTMSIEEIDSENRYKNAI